MDAQNQAQRRKRLEAEVDIESILDTSRQQVGRILDRIGDSSRRTVDDLSDQVGNPKVRPMVSVPLSAAGL